MTEVVCEEVTSFDEAVARGSRIYFTGEPRRNGHLSPRYVASKGCKACNLANAAGWRKANPELAAKRNETWWKENEARLRVAARERRKNNKERHNAWNRAWSAKHKESINARVRAAYHANRDAERARKLKWRLANKEKEAEYRRLNAAAIKAAKKPSGALRRARERSAPGRFTQADVLARLVGQRRRCAYCRTKLIGDGYHVDHIVALSRGGTNLPANIQMLCAKCNISKHAKDPIEFAQSKGLLI